MHRAFIHRERPTDAAAGIFLLAVVVAAMSVIACADAAFAAVQPVHAAGLCCWEHRGEEAARVALPAPDRVERLCDGFPAWDTHPAWSTPVEVGVPVGPLTPISPSGDLLFGRLLL